MVFNHWFAKEICVCKDKVFAAKRENFGTIKKQSGTVMIFTENL